MKQYHLLIIGKREDYNKGKIKYKNLKLKNK